MLFFWLHATVSQWILFLLLLFFEGGVCVFFSLQYLGAVTMPELGRLFSVKIGQVDLYSGPVIIRNTVTEIVLAK